MTRIIAIIVAILGLVGLVFGIMFVLQAGSAEQAVSTEIQPLKIADVNSKYDDVKAKQMSLAATEEPQIQAGKVAPSAMYTYLTVQRTSLGLAKTNIGLAAFVRTCGIIEIIIGLGLILAGILFLKKTMA